MEFEILNFSNRSKEINKIKNDRKCAVKTVNVNRSRYYYDIEIIFYSIVFTWNALNNTNILGLNIEVICRRLVRRIF